jgi:hypothetical protein
LKEADINVSLFNKTAGDRIHDVPLSPVIKIAGHHERLGVIALL